MRIPPAPPPPHMTTTPEPPPASRRRRPSQAAQPELAAFFEALFRGAPPEDVTRYTAASLAELAPAGLHAFASGASPARRCVELFHFRAEGDDIVRNETVLLAVNDDRPFLFDSLIGEVSAQGARIHALFHPIVTVTRDADGVRAKPARTLRESVIVADPRAGGRARSARPPSSRAPRTSSPRCVWPCATGRRCRRASAKPSTR